MGRGFQEEEYQTEKVQLIGKCCGCADAMAAYELEQHYNSQHGQTYDVAVWVWVDHHDPANEQDRAFPYFCLDKQITLQSGGKANNANNGGNAG